MSSFDSSSEFSFSSSFSSSFGSSFVFSSVLFTVYSFMSFDSSVSINDCESVFWISFSFIGLSMFSNSFIKGFVLSSFSWFSKGLSETELGSSFGIKIEESFSVIRSGTSSIIEFLVSSISFDEFSSSGSSLTWVLWFCIIFVIWSINSLFSIIIFIIVWKSIFETFFGSSFSSSFGSSFSVSSFVMVSGISLFVFDEGISLNFSFLSIRPSMKPLISSLLSLDTVTKNPWSSIGSVNITCKTSSKS